MELSRLGGLVLRDPPFETIGTTETFPPTRTVYSLKCTRYAVCKTDFGIIGRVVSNRILNSISDLPVANDDPPLKLKFDLRR